MEKPNFAHFTLEEQDGIGIFTIRRPEVLNALNPAAWKDFEMFAKYLDQSDLRVAIITGEGPKSFIAGADINSLVGVTPLSSVYTPNSDLSDALQAFEKCRKPIIAAINGYALGGGMEVALACDIRIVADNAKLGMPEVGLGLIPGAGGTQRLARIAGTGVAKQMIFTGRNITAEEAVRLNIAMKSVPQAELMDEAIKVAQTIASRGPAAIQMAKRAINMSFDVDMATALYAERLAFAVLFSTEDYNNGTKAFLEKRPVVFTGK